MHDQELLKADVIFTKVTRNSRNMLSAAISRQQGIVILPDLPQDLNKNVSLFELSYLQETLQEHAIDLATTLDNLKNLGVKHTHKLIWKRGEDLILLANTSRHIILKETQDMISTSDLAKKILRIALKEKYETRPSPKHYSPFRGIS